MVVYKVFENMENGDSRQIGRVTSIAAGKALVERLNLHSGSVIGPVSKHGYFYETYWDGEVWYRHTVKGWK